VAGVGRWCSHRGIANRMQPLELAPPPPADGQMVTLAIALAQQETRSRPGVDHHILPAQNGCRRGTCTLHLQPVVIDGEWKELSRSA
jgi:hypothetical protein